MTGSSRLKRSIGEDCLQQTSQRVEGEAMGQGRQHFSRAQPLEALLSLEASLQRRILFGRGQGALITWVSRHDLSDLALIEYGDVEAAVRPLSKTGQDAQSCLGGRSTVATSAE